ncbi:hypothetical protein HMPREF1410_01146 [Helicobacter pylori GAM249T]|nr:hypothetical protein HMPREF1410_01146 [Helicobacter pylori GAM249T]
MGVSFFKGFLSFELFVFKPFVLNFLCFKPSFLKPFVFFGGVSFLTPFVLTPFLGENPFFFEPFF